MNKLADLPGPKFSVGDKVYLIMAVEKGKPVYDTAEERSIADIRFNSDGRYEYLLNLGTWHTEDSLILCESHAPQEDVVDRQFPRFDKQAPLNKIKDDAKREIYRLLDCAFERGILRGNSLGKTQDYYKGMHDLWGWIQHYNSFSVKERHLVFEADPFSLKMPEEFIDKMEFYENSKAHDNILDVIDFFAGDECELNDGTLAIFVAYLDSDRVLLLLDAKIMKCFFSSIVKKTGRSFPDKAKCFLDQPSDFRS